MPYHQITDPARLQKLLDAVLVIESDLDITTLLRRIIEAATDLVSARYGALGILDPSGRGLSEFLTVGVDEATRERIGHLPRGLGLLGLLIREPQPVRLDRIDEHPASVGFPAGHPPMTSFLGTPIRVRGQVYGIIYLTEKEGAKGFSEADQALVEAVASAAGIAVDNARLHARVRELSLAQDRERIARDLHDTVIQRIFAVALSLQATEGLTSDPALADRLETAVNELDETIRQIRTTIFALEPPPTAHGGLRSQVLQVAGEAARSLGFEPAVRFTGPVDTVEHHVGAEVLAVLREALSNVARHARAGHVQVNVTASSGDLLLEVADDGVGPRLTSAPGNGLPNMADRARALGGKFELSAGDGGGTRIEWRVPLAEGQPVVTGEPAGQVSGEPAGEPSL